ncbi:MAG: decarboxylating 6-phosphogluconate dehydrogenase [Gemmatimonadales bacterium]|nr:decarboxylating 6-phosphogluconate dehydrogenase [Gemmatimonadales bacterium]
MKLGMIGLGKMGGNMTLRLMRAGHDVVVHDLDAAAIARAVADGATGVASIAAMVDALPTPRVVWIMVPAGAATESTIDSVAAALQSGDVIIDGGNSNYKDSQRRALALAPTGVTLVDVGTSGGVWGLKEGYSIMAGGTDEAIAVVRPILEALAPATDAGWGHVGPSGAGHFVKMIHNGVEYGMMQAYAEGFALMERKAELDLDLEQVAEIWRHGSVVRSWLLDLTAAALKENPDLDGIAPWVPDSGEGRWTVMEAIDLAVSIPVITLALQQRFRSRDESPFADKLLAAMRNQFGGHAIKRAADQA